MKVTIRLFITYCIPEIHGSLRFILILPPVRFRFGSVSKYTSVHSASLEIKEKRRSRLNPDIVGACVARWWSRLVNLYREAGILFRRSLWPGPFSLNCPTSSWRPAPRIPEGQEFPGNPLAGVISFIYGKVPLAQYFSRACVARRRRPPATRARTLSGLTTAQQERLNDEK